MCTNKTISIIAILLIFGIQCSPQNNINNIRIALSGNPPTLDWNLATDGISYQVITQIMEGLTQYDENLNVIPAIAASWDVLDKGQKYIFHIDPRYIWSDGKPVKAGDFRDSWVRLLAPETASEYAYFLFDIEGSVDFNKGVITTPDKLGIKVLDDQTLEVRLIKPVAFFPSLLSFMVTYPIRKDLIEKYGDHWTDPDKLVTCGPFILKDYWPEYRIQLVQNSFYGGFPKPDLQQITFFVVPDATTALTLATSHLMDVSPLPPLALPHYQNDAQLVRQNKLRGTYFGFNLRQKPFDDVNFRKALTSSLNKKELPEILKGGEKPIDSWIVPPLLAFNDHLGLKFDPVSAKRFLAQSQYDKNQTLTLYFNSDATIKKIAEWAQSQWNKNLGITIHLETMEWKAYLGKLHNEPPGFFRLGWGADYPDPDNFMNLFTSASGNNFTDFHNAAYDRLVSQAASTIDADKRIELYDEAQKMLLQDHCVIIPLYVASQYLWVDQKFQPYPITPMDFAYLKKIKTHAIH